MTPRVLIADNDRLSVILLESVLSSILGSIEIRSAFTVAEAIRVGRYFAPDLLISDWCFLEDDDGGTIAKVLSAANPELKIIFVSGMANELSEKVSSLPIIDILEKPILLDDLEEALQLAFRELNRGFQNRAA